MKKEVIAEQAIYKGTAKFPEGFEIDNQNIKSNIIYAALVVDSRKDKNPYGYKHNDFYFEDCENVDKLKIFIRDHFLGFTKKSLIFHSQFAHLFLPNKGSINKQQAEPFDLKNSPDFTCLYCLENTDQKLVLEFNENRYKQRTHLYSLKETNFIIFPSETRYYFTENKAERPSIWLGINYFSN